MPCRMGYHVGWDHRLPMPAGYDARRYHPKAWSVMTEFAAAVCSACACDSCGAAMPCSCRGALPKLPTCFPPAWHRTQHGISRSMASHAAWHRTQGFWSRRSYPKGRSVALKGDYGRCDRRADQCGDDLPDGSRAAAPVRVPVQMWPGWAQSRCKMWSGWAQSRCKMWPGWAQSQADVTGRLRRRESQAADELAAGGVVVASLSAGHTYTASSEITGH